MRPDKITRYSADVSIQLSDFGFHDIDYTIAVNLDGDDPTNSFLREFKGIVNNSLFAQAKKHVSALDFEANVSITICKNGDWLDTDEFTLDFSECDMATDSVDDGLDVFLKSKSDSYAIFQLRDDVADNTPLRFMCYSYLQEKGIEPKIGQYHVVYNGKISPSEDVKVQLEDLYAKFNNNRPDDFKGRSMSVSDIVALKFAGEISCYYVDSIGFVKLPGYLLLESMCLEDLKNDT